MATLIRWLTRLATALVLGAAIVAGLLLLVPRLDPGLATSGPLIRQAWAWYYTHTGSSHFCPICQSRLSGFHSFGGRRNVVCAVCGSWDRHRRDWLYMQQRTDLFDGRPKKMLHVAPERDLGKLFRQIPNIDYLSGDLDPEVAMVKMDITDIQFPDNTFDVIYCSHVLEHVPDDRRAMRELYRVLKPGGWAILHVPILREVTYEDSSVTTPEARLRVFGQADHVRMYGLDYADRLREAGFEVTVEPFVDSFTTEEVESLGLPPIPDSTGRQVYISRKLAASPMTKSVQ